MHCLKAINSSTGLQLYFGARRRTQVSLQETLLRQEYNPGNKKAQTSFTESELLLLDLIIQLITVSVIYIKVDIARG